MERVEIFIGGAVAICAFQFWVSVRLLRSSLYESNQKWLQLGLIWLIPIVGAVVVQSMMSSEGKPRYKPEKGYTEPGDSAS